ISTTRPRGRPPTPSAMSSPSEPDEIVSMSIERSFLPSFITEPLPNWRSIWESAADRALVLSMEEPSTIRRAVADIVRAPYGGDSRAGQTAEARSGSAVRRNLVPALFYVRNMFFSRKRRFSQAGRGGPHPLAVELAGALAAPAFLRLTGAAKLPAEAWGRYSGSDG